jgi:hypothetical protein
MSAASVRPLRPVISAGEPEPLLDAAAVGRWIGISARQVLRLRIPHVQVGTGHRRIFRYRREDVRRWLEEHVRGGA